jgi:hypothetical protein
MPNRGQQLGKRRPFVRRPGIGKFPPWDGMNREGDAAACPANAFRMLINTRTDDSEIWCRGGQSSINPDDVLDGCIGGTFPPEFEPPDEAFSRLLIAERVSGVPDSAETYIYAPDELAEDAVDEPILLSPGFHSGVIGLYWSGQRLLALWQYQSDVLGAGINEYVLTRSSGSTVMSQNDDSGIALDWEGNVGGVVRVDQDYYASRYDSDAASTDALRLEKIEFISSAFTFTNEQANDITDANAVSPSLFLTAAVDGRVIWLSKSTSVATLSIRSTATGAYSQVSFPTGFTPIDTGIQAWAWHAAKLYIAGGLSGDLAIAAYDPVLNTITTVRTLSGTNPDHCPMAVHKGVLYFAYGIDAGAERVGMLRKGVWNDSVAAFPAPADIFALCSFRGHLYMTKDDFLLRCSNPSIDPTFEVFYEGSTGFPLGAMVAVP